MKKVIDLAKFAAVSDPKNYLDRRISLVDQGNEQIKELVTKIRSKLEECSVAIYKVPLKALVFYPSFGRDKSSGKKHVISTVELHHVEAMQEMERQAVNSLSIRCKCNELSNNKDSYFAFDQWTKFDDENLKFGSSVLFDNENDYLNFKEIVIELKKIYSSR